MSESAGDSARRLDAASIRHGQVRRLGEPLVPVPGDDELDYRLGFDLGYRDGMARATQDAEATADAARSLWEATARERLDAELAAVRAERSLLSTVAEAWGSRLDDDRSWASGIVVEAVYEVVARYLGKRHADAALMAELCAQSLRNLPERPLVVRVSPQDLEQVSAQVSGLADVRSDERLSPGDCEIDSPRGRLVAGIAARMDILRDELLDRLAAREARGGGA